MTVSERIRTSGSGEGRQTGRGTLTRPVLLSKSSVGEGEHGTRGTVHGARYTGARYTGTGRDTGHGTRYTVHGAPDAAPGTGHRAPTTTHQAPGTRHQAPRAVSASVSAC